MRPRAGLLCRIAGRLCRGAHVFGFATWAQAAGMPGAGWLCALWEHAALCSL